VHRGTPAVLAGGTKAALSPDAPACQATSGRLTPAFAPEAGYEPFDVAANGHVPGEGGAVLLVDDADSAACAASRSSTGRSPGTQRPTTAITTRTSHATRFLVLAMRAHWPTPAAYGLDLVREPRRMPVRLAPVNAPGCGGFNSSLVVLAVDSNVPPLPDSGGPRI
jgi:3-oxoacyl-(acyl-carrier-protein) synthase